jgi:hypothetical protein
MSAPCPPGSFRNPISSRCVKVTGRRARELYEGGVVDYGAMAAGVGVPVYGAPQPAAYRRAETRRNRVIDIVGAFAGRGSSSGNTRRRPRYAAVEAGPLPAVRQVGIPAVAARPAAPIVAAPVDIRNQPCPPNKVRNPRTARCVVIGGRAYKEAGIGPAPEPVVHKEPAAVLKAREVRRSSSEGRPDLPLHAAAVAPLADRATILGWAAGNCKEQKDVITGIPFRNMDATALQQLIRLHNRTCTLAPPLHAKVAAEHRVGTVATLPGQPDTQMVLADFKALRDAMRRDNPAYKLPGRRHQPPPPNWQLYVARDARSGPDYMSVMYVDATKGRMTPIGVEYPPESVKVDMGFIPIKPVTGALCDIKLIVETLQQLAAANRLLEPIPGGWKPIAGFPFTKSYWTRETATRLSIFCRLLIRALTTPI